ncbi:hypothetical protein HOY82DRAFT_619738 [Tuber indicum]|nr:hypothetical protein HOY82DRAFT_619738 [Tuber indicum]
MPSRGRPKKYTTAEQRILARRKSQQKYNLSRRRTLVANSEVSRNQGVPQGQYSQQDYQLDSPLLQSGQNLNSSSISIATVPSPQHSTALEPGPLPIYSDPNNSQYNYSYMLMRFLRESEPSESDHMSFYTYLSRQSSNFLSIPGASRHSQSLPESIGAEPTLANHQSTLNAGSTKASLSVTYSGHLPDVPVTSPACNSLTSESSSGEQLLSDSYIQDQGAGSIGAMSYCNSTLSNNSLSYSSSIGGNHKRPSNSQISRNQDNIPHDTSSLPCDNGSNSGDQTNLARFIASSLLNFVGCRDDNAISSGMMINASFIKRHSNFMAASNQHKRPSQSVSIRASVDRIPAVLNSPVFLDSGSTVLSPSLGKLVYSGILSDNNELSMESISFEKNHLLLRRNITTLSSYDIDSVLAFPSSLRFSKLGIKIAFAPARYANIQSDLHIRVPLRHVKRAKSRIQSAPISDIPHIHLGQVTGADEYKIFLLFPQLMHDGQATNYLSDTDLARFYDNIFIPAIEEHCPANLLQHLPGSFEMAKFNAEAPGYESRTRITGTNRRTQSLLYHIPYRYLHQIWLSVQATSRLPGNHDFQDIIIFLNAKNLKLTTTSSDPTTTINLFNQEWNRVCDLSAIDPTATWLDLAQETVHEPRTTHHPIPADDLGYDAQFPPSGNLLEHFVFQWKQCCLKSYEATFRSLYNHDSCQFRYYPWAMTGEIGNLTVTPGPVHPARKDGLAYAQFYSTLKEVFDAAKVYPFQNPGLEGLAIDPYLQKTWRDIGGTSHWTKECATQAYLSSKRRIAASLDASSNKSFGLRQEYRVLRPLLQDIYKECQSYNPPDLQSPFLLQNNPVVHFTYIVSPTSETIQFLHGNINKYCFGFEYLLSLQDGKAIDWEHSRMMIMFLRLLKHSYGGTHLERFPEIWKNNYSRDNISNSGVGLNLEHTSSLRGYGFLPSNLINWDACRFSSTLSPLLGFSNPYLARNFRHHTVAISEATNCYHLFTEAISNMVKYPHNRLLQSVTFQILSCTLIELFRQDLWSTLLSDGLLINGAFQPLSLPTASLCVPNLSKLLDDDFKEFKFIQNYNRHKFHPFERVTYLWDYDDQRKRKSWDNKQWRKLFQMTCEQLNFHSPDSDIQEQFRGAHFASFLTHNLIFPHPVNHKYHQKTKDNPGQKQRIWFCAYNPNRRFLWNAEDWTCGSVTDGLYNSEVPATLPYTQSVLPDLLACVTEDRVLNDSLHNLKQHRAHALLQIRNIPSQ